MGSESRVEPAPAVVKLARTKATIRNEEELGVSEQVWQMALKNWKMRSEWPKESRIALGGWTEKLGGVLGQRLQCAASRPGRGERQELCVATSSLRQ